MSVSAGLAAVLLRGFGFIGDGVGTGAMAGLPSIGPFLDADLWGAPHGWRIWLSLALCALASNGLAFIARGVAELQTQPAQFDAWLQRVAPSYLACGILAGLFSGMVGFAARRSAEEDSKPT
jgi:hypothetical protein